MAGKTISQLTAATSVSASDEVKIESGGVSKKMSLATLMAFILAPPAGSMLPYAGAAAPTGYLLCHGQAVSRTTYADLFTNIGTTWGVGDNSTTFNVPDMRETTPVGIGTSGSSITAHDVYTLGEFKDDQFQGHKFDITVRSGAAALGISDIGLVSATGTLVSAGFAGATTPVSDSTNGTPRTGTVTRGKRIGVNYIIKY